MTPHYHPKISIMNMILFISNLFLIALFANPLYADDAIVDTEIVAAQNLQVVETPTTIVIAGIDANSNVQVRKFDKAARVFSSKAVLDLSLTGTVQSNTFRMIYNPKAGNILMLIEVLNDSLSNIYGLLFDVNGEKLPGMDPVSLTGTDPSGKYFSPEVAVDTSTENGSYLVAYSNDAATADTTYGRFFDASLLPVGNRFEIATNGPCAGIIYIPGTGNYYIAYKQTIGTYLFGRFISDQGGLIGNTAHTIGNLYLSSWSSLGRKPYIAYFPSLDKILAVWRVAVSETAMLIKGRLISSDPFAANEAEFTVSKDASKQLDPVIIDNGRIVLWTDDRGGTASVGKDVYAQAVGPFGSALDTDFRVVPAAVSQEYATAACIDLAQKTYLVFWRQPDGKFYSLIRELPISTDPGDVDGNLEITLADAVLACRVASGVDADVTVQADVNNDKLLGLEEIVFVLQKVAGLRG